MPPLVAQCFSAAGGSVSPPCSGSDAACIAAVTIRGTRWVATCRVFARHVLLLGVRRSWGSWRCRRADIDTGCIALTRLVRDVCTDVRWQWAQVERVTS